MIFKPYKLFLNFVMLIFCISVISCGSTKNKSNTAVKPQKGLATYANKMGVSIATLKNKDLYAELDTWIGTPYLYGGTSRKGTDCSGFVQQVYRTVYQVKLGRTTSDQVKQINTKSIKNLKEGDLVFFNTNKRNSHVGIYLHNGWFVHASTTHGVVLSDLKSEYYRKRFNRGGAVK